LVAHRCGTALAVMLADIFLALQLDCGAGWRVPRAKSLGASAAALASLAPAVDETTSNGTIEPPPGSLLTPDVAFTNESYPVDVQLQDEPSSARYAAWFQSVSGWNSAFDTTPSPNHVAGSNSENGAYEWQILPSGLLYRSYLAGEKEPRVAWTRLNDRNRGALWEVALGGRVGLVRYGTRGPWGAEGWQIDLEGAALPRVDPELSSHPLEAVDFRVGLLWTRRRGPTAVKAGYYHLSSHLGDEFLLLNPGFPRVNYVRDSLIAGVTQDVTPDLQAYGEIGYAISTEGGAEPLEFQFGLQYLPLRHVWHGGAPFAAVNGHLREEVDFGGGINVLAGWRWRGSVSGHVLRVGLQYYNGKSIQYSFFNRDEQLAGFGIWFDY
jgi:hypothetical protein